MKYLRKFNEDISIYNKSWESLLPPTITVIKGQDSGIDKHIYTKGNIMLNADMLQISYDINKWSVPDTLEIDIYFVKDVENNFIRLNIDITYGDEVACEFSIDKKNGVKLVQDTTYHSKFDPSNTVFAFDDDSLRQFVDFLNKFNTGVKVSTYDLRFLDQYDNY